MGADETRPEKSTVTYLIRNLSRSPELHRIYSSTKLFDINRYIPLNKYTYCSTSLLIRFHNTDKKADHKWHQKGHRWGREAK